jgi:hypothetical protein
MRSESSSNQKEVHLNPSLLARPFSLERYDVPQALFLLTKLSLDTQDALPVSLGGCCLHSLSESLGTSINTRCPPKCGPQLLSSESSLTIKAVTHQPPLT